MGLRKHGLNDNSSPINGIFLRQVSKCKIVLLLMMMVMMMMMMMIYSVATLFNTGNTPTVHYWQSDVNHGAPHRCEKAQTVTMTL